jgi:hypothetical protein
VISWGRSGGIDNSPPSGGVASSLAQAHLLSRGPGSLSFRGGRVASGGALRTPLGRPLCNSRLRLFPLHSHGTSPCGHPRSYSTGCPRGAGHPPEVEAPTRESSGCISAVPLRVSEALVAFTLQGALWRHIFSTVIQRPQIWVIDRTLDTSGPRATDTNK